MSRRQGSILTRRFTKPSRHVGSQKLSLESLENRIVLAAPQFVSVQPNGGDVLSTAFADVLNTSPRELTVRFDQEINGSPQSLAGVEVLRDGTPLDAVSREKGLLGNTVILRFAETLPDDVYSINVTSDLSNLLGENFDPQASANAVLPLDFELDLGTRVAAVVPQPVSRNGDALTHALDQIEVYFNSDQLETSLVEDEAYYRLILTQDTVTNTDDEFFQPTSAIYEHAESKVVLTFGDDLHNLAGGSGTFRLRVGTNETDPTNMPLMPEVPDVDPGDSFSTAYDDANGQPRILSDGSQIIASSIETRRFPLSFPGSGEEPGQNPFFTSSPDMEDGVSVMEYNFQDFYGGGTAVNLITEPQKQRVREAMEIYSQVAGVDVVETDNVGLVIATGDPALAGPDDLVFNASTNWNVEAFATGTPAVQGCLPPLFLEFLPQGSPSYFEQVLNQLVGCNADLSTGDIRFLANESAEPVFPRNDVVVAAQHQFRPDSTDVDLYRFEIDGTSPGLFTAEITAERSAPTSLLDSMLRLYRQTPSGARQLIAQNDDYFSEDSFLQLDLEPGTYFIGVSSTGNDEYDPRVGANEIQRFDLGAATDGTFRIDFGGALSMPIAYDAAPADVEAILEAMTEIGPGNVSVTGAPGSMSIEFAGFLGLQDLPEIQLRTLALVGGTPSSMTVIEGATGTGFGGTSEGNYELRLDFRPAITDSLRDVSGVALDGNGDGNPGGVYNFWFRAAAPSGTGVASNEVQEFGLGAATGGSFGITFDGQTTSQIPFDASAANVQTALESLANIQPGDVSVTGSQLPAGPISIEFTGNLSLQDLPEITLDTGALVDGTPVVSTVTEGARDARVIYVDKADTTADELPGGDPAPDVGTLANPYNVIHAALNLDINGLPLTGSAMDPNAAVEGDIVRILGNGDSPETSLTYQVGLSAFNNQPLADGAKLDVPNDVTLMVDAGAVFQMRRSAIVVGSTAVGIDHSLAGLQVLGTPTRQAVFTSFRDLGGTGSPARGDWGGILFASDLDRGSLRERYEERAIFLNHVGQADIRFGGGIVNVGSVPQEIAPVDIRDARPTVTFSRFTTNAVAAMTATPDSFEETNFHSPEFQTVRFTADYTRIGPDIHSNRLTDNTINGMFLRIETPAGNALTSQTVSARWDDVDIPHVLAEVLEIQGTPGGPFMTTARTDARLTIDPNVIVKLDGARIEVGVGAQLIAEGLDGHEVVFTSVNDDRFGASGSFDTSNNDDAFLPAPGDWGGLYVGHSGSASLDHALLTFGGGFSAVEGKFVGFNVLEIHQANARIANSTFVDNGSGLAGLLPTTREGRTKNGAATLFVRNAQPVIIDNVFFNAGDATPPSRITNVNDLVAAISIDVNSLNRSYVVDPGRTTGGHDRLALVVGGNQGPLVRGNRIQDNDINGMLIRGATLDTEGVWDDTSIPHVMFEPVYVPDFNSHGGLRLESSEKESLVVKLGGDAGFHATGTKGQINDRIGGSIHVIGQPGRPVVMTSISDSSVGAGLRLDGSFQNETVRPGLGEPQASSGFNIDFNLSLDVEQNVTLVAALEDAARFWESRLTDDIDIRLDVTVMDIESPGTAAQAGATGFVAPFDDVIARMQLDAAPDEADLLNRLPMFSQLTVVGPAGSGLTADANIALGYPNAKALGYDPPPVASLVTSGATRDGGITVDSINAMTSTLDGLVPTMIHEIGHALGFSSALPEDGMLGAGITLSTWDLFRLAPGAGAIDFTNSPRIFDQMREQVIYDGVFDPTGIDIAGLSIGDIPVSRGTEFPDGTMHPDDGQPSHWRSSGAAGMNGIVLGIMDPSGGAGQVTGNDLRSLGLMGYDVAGFSLSDTATPGDWMGVRLDELSNDRNSQTLLELEGSDADSPDVNRIPDRAQFVGALAAGEFLGDENLRLGFEIHGVLNKPSDVDVFSFQGTAGTEVLFDIDNTSSAVDTVVELVNVNAQVLAASNDSINGGGDLVGSASVTPGPLVDPVAFYPFDHFSVNPKDAGMRLTLPGTPGTRGTYFVRVQSDQNLTQGAYELNLRLGEVDEVPGSTVRFADIRFADIGIESAGLISHSPIQTEFSEPNDAASFEQGINLGSPSGTDRGEISISGVLESRSTVELTVNDPLVGDVMRDYVVGRGIDWYKFNAPSGLPTSGFSIDLDYAAGAGGPDTFLAVYRIGFTDGRDPDTDEGDEIVYDLVYFGSSSDVEDDQGFAFSEGSFSVNDPFIGPVGVGGGIDTQVLRDDTTREPVVFTNSYLIGVMSEGTRPEELHAQYNFHSFTEQLTTGPTEFIERREYDLAGEFSPVAFGLDDITLYVTAEDSGASTLQAVNPFTGAIREQARAIADEDTGYLIRSLEMRPDGSLFALRVDPSMTPMEDISGNLLAIDWANPVDQDGLPLPIAENLGDDGIIGHIEEPPANPGDPPMYPECDCNDGIQFFGMDIGDLDALAVGERGGKADPMVQTADYTENIVYQIDIYPTEIDFNDTDPGAFVPDEPVREDDDGSATWFGLNKGSLTQAVELGAFTTNGGPAELIQGLARINGRIIGVSDAGSVYELIPGGFNTGPGTTIFLGSVAGASFSGLETAPANLQGGALANTLFGITSGGQIIAFDLSGVGPNSVVLQNVFDTDGDGVADGSTLSTGVTGAQGLAFSTLDVNLWEADADANLLTFTAPFPTGPSFLTGNQSPVNDFNRDLNFPGGAHGAFDLQIDLTGADGRTGGIGSRPTLYFEYQLRTELPIDAAANDTPPRDPDEPNDSDTLDPQDDFFEDTLRDVFRVYATTVPSPAETDWVLVASNNTPDFFSAGPVGLEAQELYDDTRLFQADDDINNNDPFFRQARVPLEEFAGNMVTLRFEFSTEGTFFENGATDIRTGHEFGNAEHVPVRRGESPGGLTDNQVPAEVEADNAFLGVEIRNVFAGNAERGELVNRTIISEPDGSATPPRIIAVGGADSGNYQLYIRPASFVPADPMNPVYQTNDRFASYNPEAFMTPGTGDTNRFRDQGQLVIESNQISDSARHGIRIGVSEKVPAGAADLIVNNSSRLVRGAVLENNLVARSGVSGIFLDGDATSIGAVPSSRLVNNTVVGTVGEDPDTTIGIEIGPNVSPTVLNNLVAYTDTAIDLSTASASSVIAGMLFHGNANNGPTGQFPIFSTPTGGIQPDDGLFRNPAAGNYLLVDGAAAIDSAINSQEDRPALTSVLSSLGLDFVSPVLAPDRDLLGQLRVDDPAVESPPGLGANVIKDRGAFERSDRIGPRSELLRPMDEGPEDMASGVPFVVITAEGPIEFFSIRLSDIDVSGNDLFGVGVDDSTVVPEAIVVKRNDETLLLGLDYDVSYDSANNIILLVPKAGVWVKGSYEVELLPDMITDLAGNPLAPNQLGVGTEPDTTKFFIDLITEPGPEGDYGDAPLPYPTLFANNGAVHVDTSTVFLGAGADVETDGKPSSNADADSDDGVSFSGDLLVARDHAVTVTASDVGFLSAWVDFNGDGDWNDPGERVFTNEALSQGDNSLTFGTPQTATDGVTFARFRFSSTADLGPRGVADDGEVEDYQVTIVDAGIDYGDADAPFATLNAEDGARHAILPGFFLGAGVDSEADGQPSADGMGDGADEDGVSLPGSFVPGASNEIVVQASQAGFLNAWIDLNGDGDWLDADEQIAVDQALVAGANMLSVDLPVDAVETQVFARFRFSSTAGLGFTGLASDGEVEDYLISINSASWHNAANSRDVDNDGAIGPVDALLILTELDLRQDSDPDTGLLNAPAGPPPFYDVDNDGFASPLDALLVINDLPVTSGSSVIMAPSSSGADNRLRAFDPDDQDVDDVFGEWGQV